MEKKRIAVRIVAAGLAALMLLGVLISAITALAADAELLLDAAPVATGGDIPKWPIIAAVAAVVVVVGCIVVPKLLKKGDGEDSASDDTDTTSDDAE